MMIETQQVNIEELFAKLINWGDDKKQLMHWIFFLAMKLREESFFHRVGVLQYCDEKDFKALQTIFPSYTVNIVFKDMKIFLHSEDFIIWLECMKSILGDIMFIFLVTFLLSFNADIDGKITADKSLNTYLSNKPELKILFYTLSAILRRECLKKQSQ